MARIFIDGFESGEHDMWDTISGVTVVSSAGKDMDGDYCLSIDHGQSMKKDISANTTYYFAFLFRDSDISESDAYFRFYNGSTEICRLRVESRILKAYRGSSDLLGSGTKTIDYNVTYLIEIKLVIHDTTGEFIVKVDGITDINLTSQDTKPGTDTTINKVMYQVAGFYGPCYVDNIIIDDAAWIGKTNIQALIPTAGGNSTGWTPSAGSNFACVDEIPPSDADFVSINANNVVDSYVASDLSGSIDNIKCVQVQSRVRSEGTPTPTQLQLVVRSSGTDYFSASKAVSASEKGLYALWATDPATSVAWLEAAVNSAEIGVKSIA